jgi:hypothetical protein
MVIGWRSDPFQIYDPEAKNPHPHPQEQPRGLVSILVSLLASSIMESYTLSELHVQKFFSWELSVKFLVPD